MGGWGGGRVGYGQDGIIKMNAPTSPLSGGPIGVNRYVFLVLIFFGTSDVGTKGRGGGSETVSTLSCEGGNVFSSSDEGN